MLQHLPNIYSYLVKYLLSLTDNILAQQEIYYIRKMKHKLYYVIYIN